MSGSNRAAQGPRRTISVKKLFCSFAILSSSPQKQAVVGPHAPEDFLLLLRPFHARRAAPSRCPEVGSARSAANEDGERGFRSVPVPAGSAVSPGAEPVRGAWREAACCCVGGGVSWERKRVALVKSCPG